ncbi:MAG TPA: hypothetical protein VHM24_12720 [Gemmatimonadaceae bacterium]|nr:hypothetical protein [Gemmatimonadaceae bacterium]
MSWMRVVFTGIALCAVASVAGAQDGAKGERQRGERQRGAQGQRGGRGLAVLFEGITLTDAQQAKIEAIRAKYAGERQKLGPNDGGGPRDPGTRKKMSAIMEKQGAEFRAILTPAQQKIFDANVEKRKDAMKRRKEG